MRIKDLLLASGNIASPDPEITYLGVSVNPVDGGSLSTNPTPVTPIAGLVAGDLVILITSTRSATSTNTISSTGGQTWNALTDAPGVNQNTTRMFWCIFNGVWTANPSFSATAGTPRTCGMIAFRPSAPGKSWAVNVTVAHSTGTYPSAGNVVTVTGQTTTGSEQTVSIALIFNNASTIYSAAASPWKNGGGNQYNNTAQLNLAITYQIKKVAGATGDMQKTIVSGAGLGNTGQSIISFNEV